MKELREEYGTDVFMNEKKISFFTYTSLLSQFIG